MQSTSPPPLFETRHRFGLQYPRLPPGEKKGREIKIVESSKPRITAILLNRYALLCIFFYFFRSSVDMNISQNEQFVCVPSSLHFQVTLVRKQNACKWMISNPICGFQKKNKGKEKNDPCGVELKVD